MSLNRTISLSIDDSIVVWLEVLFIEKVDKPDEFRVAVKREPSGEPQAEAVWHVQEREGQFTLQITSQNVKMGVCLAGCLAGIVTSAGPLVDCLKRARSRKDVRDCINKHGVWQTISSLSCIYGCLAI